MPNQPVFNVYGTRWVILLTFMLVVAFNQLLWITFAPITSIAAAYYHVSDLSIGLLSLSFLIAYLVVSIPASWLIDTYGFRVAVGIGAGLTGVFGLIRGLVAYNYTWVLAAQIGIAIGQLFILNALTKVAARWFPLGERATASGFGSLAIYVGILVGLALTPILALRAGLAATLVLYGAGARAPTLAPRPAGTRGTRADAGRAEPGDPPARLPAVDADLLHWAGGVQLRHDLD